MLIGCLDNNRYVMKIWPGKTTTTSEYPFAYPKIYLSFLSELLTYNNYKVYGPPGTPRLMDWPVLLTPKIRMRGVSI